MIDSFNGRKVLAVLPAYVEMQTEPIGYVLMMRGWGARGEEWITASVRTLDQPDWGQGHYFTSPGAAMADAYIRAGATDPRRIAARAKVGRIS